MKGRLTFCASQQIFMHDLYVQIIVRKLDSYKNVVAMKYFQEIKQQKGISREWNDSV